MSATTLLNLHHPNTATPRAGFRGNPPPPPPGPPPILAAQPRLNTGTPLVITGKPSTKRGLVSTILPHTSSSKPISVQK